MILAKPYIIDTTLRDGEQAPGVVFSSKEKYKIAEMLDIMGVHEIEAGTPAVGFEEQKIIKDISNAGFSFVTSCWCRARIDDIVEASKLGTESVNISLPVSDIQIDTLGKSKEWILSESKKMASFAKQYFSKITFGAQDATRAERNFLKEFIFYLNESGADRIRIADTVGICDPIETYELIIDLKKCFPDTEFEFHGHNDFGMATANAISAIKAGVNCISATVNGLGERAGNSALEEIIAYLYVRNNDRRFSANIIGRLTEYIAEISNVDIPVNKAITGKNAFRHESGIHTSAMLKNIESYQILDPSSYGVKNTAFSFGKHSGKASIISFFRGKGIEIDEITAKDILVIIKQIVSERKKEVTEEELIAIYIDIRRHVKTIKIYGNK